ncbi:MAG: hypothetical protein WAM60_19530 [Candidatus Promineifilaceae bacterium]
MAGSWRRSFGSRPSSTAEADIRYRLDVVNRLVAAPVEEPQFRQENLIAYYMTDRGVVAHFPRYGRLDLDLTMGKTEGRIVREALNTYGVLEDIIAIGLSPHLRRRNMFLIHAFAAAYEGRAALLVGGVGAGKTTTGMALLNAGWRLLSNDSPILTGDGEVLSYPGVLAAYGETFGRFPATAHLASQKPDKLGRAKITIEAEAIWPDVWLDSAPAGAIFFPQIESRKEHLVERLSAPEALRRLLPHAVEQWDRVMIGRHLGVLRNLVEKTPAYLLRLGPDVLGIPGVVGEWVIG